MDDSEQPQEPQEVQVDYTKYDEDSVPESEKEIKHTHPGRPDLDYDDTPVGPAPGTGDDA
ncbi:hypothetical protein PRIPAC_72329 [Pristionchus pacificus]|uniref:Uncharacterized protein n=1 Tax=Pristionchus pacificus TaxID=54126 RepID=A0A454XL76_PRIPA|nr:hypothetical protein PRIPAC_72329 [Pristionchus pacificus]|eukprot:PDM60876.1 hypothetical protein PRIPAC_54682 [Pristionchus pacificus]